MASPEQPDHVPPESAGAQPSHPTPGPPPPFLGAPPGGYQPYGYPHPYHAPRRTNGMAVASMVVSLASLVTCPLIGAVGIYLGNRAKEEIRVRGEDGEGMATAGVIVGWIAVAFSIFYVCLLLGVLGTGAIPFIVP